MGYGSIPGVVEDDFGCYVTFCGSEFHDKNEFHILLLQTIYPFNMFTYNSKYDA